MRERPVRARWRVAAAGRPPATPPIRASFSFASFSELEPSVYVADLVLVSARLVVVIEVQLTRDPKKRTSWPLYAASAHLTYQRPTWLVVIALDARVAAWAREPIASFHGGSFTPLVIGPEDVPRVIDAETARRLPELAVLSALAHGRKPGAEDVGVAGMIGAAAVAQDDEDRGKLYADAVMHALDDTSRAVLEAKMKAQGYEYQSEFARRYLAEGIAKGREEGREEGLRAAVRLACELLGLGWSAGRERHVAALDATRLEALCATIERERRWPLE